MNLYQVLNQDLRDFRLKKSLLESEENNQKVIESTEIESEEDELASRLVGLTDALETASEDEVEGIKAEISEIQGKLNEISANKDLEIPEEDPVITDSEDEPVVEDPVTEPTEVTEIVTEEVSDDKIKLPLEELKDLIEDLSDEDKEKLLGLLNEVKEDTETTEEPIEEVEEPINEDLHECEITNFKIVRVAPSVNAYMIEAQTKEGIKFITGKNFNQEEKTLDEAEISDSKSDASNRFKSLLEK